ncbi:uncharacterized protein LOC121690128 isoform X2 [Alosa sapidissima]|uniref:uncharacterized protein LOC121690128 isoform X2 n=1 Tax=Alosa sapidissima TaxID=34773 RepID=UPI001C087AED|nr:uncharacterized protein LOC121690128 isoform X2 [Alosa sapidissima]
MESIPAKMNLAPLDEATVSIERSPGDLKTTDTTTGNLQAEYQSVESCTESTSHRQSCVSPSYERPERTRSNSPVSSVISMASVRSKDEPIDFTGQDGNDPGGVPCSVCPRRACKSCLTCTASFCLDHVKQHYTAPALQKHNLVEATKDLERSQMKKYGLTAQEGVKRSESVETIVNMASLLSKGSPEIYTLITEKTCVDHDEHIKRWTFGKKDNSKKMVTILLVGETRTGKTTLINSLINYILGVKKENYVWFEISGLYEEDQTVSKTTDITLYEIYSKASPISWSIIDTPGYGHTRGLHYDKMIAERLHTLLKSYNGISSIDAIGLVVTASQNCLHDRQIYIFDTIQSLLGMDVKNNIVVFITHADDRIHQNVFKAIEEAGVHVAKTDNMPVHFLYDNFRSKKQEASENLYAAKWEMGRKSTEKLTDFLINVEKQNLKMTQDVLEGRLLLRTSVRDLENLTEQKEKELALALKIKFVVNQTSKEMVPITDRKWNAKEATCCKVCKENCHHPGCWWAADLKWCSVMTNSMCTKCPGKCPTTDHVKGTKWYVERTTEVPMTYMELQQYESQHGKKVDLKPDDVTQLAKITKLETELEEAKHEKEKLLNDAYQAIIDLEKIALKSNTLSTQVHLDFLIEKMREIGNTERIKKLQGMKDGDDARQNALSYMRRVEQKEGKK